MKQNKQYAWNGNMDALKGLVSLVAITLIILGGIFLT
jgi:hypothetical protein